MESARNWYALAGGGDGALLAESVLASIDIENDVPGAQERIDQVLTAAHDAGDIEVEVLALEPRIPVPIRALRFAERPDSVAVRGITRCMREAIEQAA